VNPKAPEHKFVIPGFGQFPRSAKPAAYLPMPFPGQFFLALTGNPKLPEHAPKPFTKSWCKLWLSISDGWGPYSKKMCSAFFKRSGLSTLKELTDRGCDPNFVMSLFSTYLWDERNAEQEQNDSNVRSHQQTLEAIRVTRDFVRRHTWEKTPETEILAEALDGAEEIARSYVNNFDFQTGRGLQNDKQNRVIYAIHHHLKKKTSGPQWRLALDLFVAAEAISIQATKRTKGEILSSGGVQRRIEPRLRSFENGHPKEALLMPEIALLLSSFGTKDFFVSKSSNSFITGTK
jgi:hypothetical protein